MKLALSTLCENPSRRTGLTTMFEDFLSHSLHLYPHLEWVVFTGPEADFAVKDPRVQYVRRFPAGNRLLPRLVADHFRVSVAARELGAAGLVTVGFVPLRSVLPSFMILISLQHLKPDNGLDPLRRFYRHQIVKRSVHQATMIIANSGVTRTGILAAYPDCDSKIIISHDAIREQYRSEKSPSEEERLRRQFGFGPGYLLWLSNFYPYKQAPLLIEAYARLPEELRRRIPLVMVGGDWWGGLAEAKARAEACGVINNIHFLGWVAEEWLAPLYRNALAFCLPSREETFGRCTAEAMACGTPCILNDIPINHEVSGGHALIVDFTKPDAVADALRRVHEDAALRGKLSAEGIVHARQFTPENMTRTRLDPILQTLSGTRQPARAPATGASEFKGRLLQVFNCYRQRGGEENFARDLEKIIGPDQLQTCWFHSQDWSGLGAPSNAKQARLMLNNPGAVKKLLAQHRAWQPEAWLVGNVYPVASLGVYEAARQQGIPVIHFVHNFRPFAVGATLWVNGRINDAGLRKNFWPEIWHGAWHRSPLRSAVMAYVLSRFHKAGYAKSINAWVTVSHFLREKFIQAGLPPERVHALHPFWNAHPEVPVRPEGDYYLFLGRLIEEKGVKVLLAAWNIILRKQGAKAPRLIIAGRGPLESKVRAAAARNPLIEYAGFITDEQKHELIAGCRAMLAPSVWWEALGAVTYEAYDYAKPMLAARSGGLTETVQPGITGELHEPGNPGELAHQVLALDKDPARRSAMGQAGRKWLLENTDPERWKEQLFKIVSQAIKSPP